MNLIQIFLLSAVVAIPSGCFGTGEEPTIPNTPANSTNFCDPSFQIEPNDEYGPKNLIAKSLDEGGISLSWLPPDGSRPTSYRIFGGEWNGPGDTEFVERGNLSGEYTSAIFDEELVLGQQYAFQVTVGPLDSIQRSNIAVAESCEDPSNQSSGEENPF